MSNDHQEKAARARRLDELTCRAQSRVRERSNFGSTSSDATSDRLILGLSFCEAYLRSGRHISISVSPRKHHQTPRLLNAITEPDVLIWPAAHASCAVPYLK